MRLSSAGARRSAACAAVTSSSGIATRPEHGCPQLRRSPICPCSISQDVGGGDRPGSSSLHALAKPQAPARPPGPSEDDHTSEPDEGSDEEPSTVAGLVSREWIDSWQPTDVKGYRQYAKCTRRSLAPVSGNQLPALRQAPAMKNVKGGRVKGQGMLQKLKTKVALKFIDQHGRSLLVRDSGSQGHRGVKYPSNHSRLWQLPSVQVHTTDCAHRQCIIIARGFMKKVPSQFPLKAHSFMSSQRLGQPMLVMIFEVNVEHADVTPRRCGFEQDDYRWVSSCKYEEQREALLEVLYMRSTWHTRGRHAATLSFHRKPGFESRHRATNAAGIPDFDSQRYPTDRRFMLYVAAACVWDKDAGKVLIAKRTKEKAKGFRGKWEWPGGKVDPGETTHQTIVREIKEEVDLDLDMDALEPTSFIEKQYFHRNLVIVFYICTKFSGTATGVEGQPIAWVTLEQLKECRDNFLPGDDVFTDIVVEVMAREGTESGNAD